VHHAVLGPEVRERLAGRRLGLGDLVLVVREDEVLTAAVDVEVRPQVLHRHRRALDVPPGTPGTPRARPRGLARLGALPDSEVQRVVFRPPGLDAVALAHLVAPPPRELAVVGLLPDVVVDVTAGGIRVTLADEHADDRLDLGDVAGRARIDGRALDVVE